LEMGIGAGVKN